MLNTRSLIFTCLIIIAFNLPCMAESGARLATVDVNKILNNLSEAKSKRAELDAMSERAKKEVEAKRDSLRDLEDDLKNVDPASSQAESFRKQAREFERFVRDTEEDLKRRFLLVNKELTDKVIAKIEKYAKSNHIDLVLDKSSGAKGPILFGSPAADITDDILNAS